MELTKEYFDQQFASLGDKFVTKVYFDEKFEQSDKKFEEKLDKLDKKLDNKLEKLDKKFDGKLANFVTNDNLDQKLEPLRDDIRDLKNDVREIKATVTRIDKQDPKGNNSLAKLYLEHDRLMKKVEKLVKNSQV